METVEVELWVMVDESGEYEVAKDAADLQAEPGQASRLLKVKLAVPVPKPVELAATIAEEAEIGELKIA